METKDKKKFAEALTALSLNFNTKRSETDQELYLKFMWEELKNQHIDAVLFAAKSALRECEYMPNLKQIIDFISLYNAELRKEEQRRLRIEHKPSPEEAKQVSSFLSEFKKKMGWGPPQGKLGADQR